MTIPPFLLQLEQQCLPVFKGWHPGSIPLISGLALVTLMGMPAAFWVMPAWQAYQAEKAQLVELEAQVSLAAAAQLRPEDIEKQARLLAERVPDIPRGPTAGALVMDVIRKHLFDAGFVKVDVQLAAAATAAQADGLEFTIEIIGPYPRIGAWLDAAATDLPWLEPKQVNLSPATGPDALSEVAMRYHAVLPAAYLKDIE